MIMTVLAWSCFSADIAGYARQDKAAKQDKEITIENPDFEKGGTGWGLRPCCTIEAGTGRSGTHALKYGRTDAKEYSVISTPVKLKPGAFYRFGAWVKTENVTESRQGGGATVALEFSKTENGKKAFLTGRYLKGLTGTNDWTFVSDTVRVPANATGMTLSLYIWKNATGTAWFDDVMVQEQGANLWTLYLRNPYNTAGDGKFLVAISYDGKLPKEKNLEVRMHIKEPEIIQRAKAADARAEFTLDKLPDGDYEIEFMILDTVKKAVLYSTVIPVKIDRKNNPAVRIDNYGRTLVNGQLFMPLGAFTGVLNAAVMDALLDAGFNCVLPYGSMSMTLHPEEPRSTGQIVKVMDLAEQKGLKVIFSGKDIGSAARHGLMEWQGAEGQDVIVEKLTALLKKHPALLAWYVNDEQPLSQVPRLTAMRRLFNRLDPDHPTYGVLYQYESLPMYGSTCDIIGVDPYPLAEKSIGRAVYAMTQARLSGLPIWVVPQMSNSAIFRADKRLADPQNPSEEKMRSLVLLEAAYDAKGFIFYKFEDLKSWKLPKDNFAKEWPKVKNVVAMLKTLEPYIMSEHPAELLSEGEVVAARLRNGDGKSAVLICAIGPDSVNTEFKLDGDYRSLYGRTVRQDGVWKFSGEGISSDILIEQ